MTDSIENINLRNQNISNQIEAILFVAPQSVNIGQLTIALDVTEDIVKAGLQTLEERLMNGAIRLQNHRGYYQLTSAPEHAETIEHFLGLEATTRLSRAALETLSIIAYQEPITRPDIDLIRGVNSDGVLRSLLGKGLIEDVGRAQTPGRPILYQTTTEFLSYFGLDSPSQLPPLEVHEEKTVDEESKNGDTV